MRENTERAYVIFNFFLKHYPNFDGEIPEDCFFQIYTEYCHLSLASLVKFRQEMLFLGILTKREKNFCLIEKVFKEKIALPESIKKNLDKQIEKLSKKIKF